MITQNVRSPFLTFNKPYRGDLEYSIQALDLGFLVQFPVRPKRCRSRIPTWKLMRPPITFPMGYAGGSKKSPNNAPRVTLNQKIQSANFCIALMLIRIEMKEQTIIAFLRWITCLLSLAYEPSSVCILIIMLDNIGISLQSTYRPCQQQLSQS